MQITKDTLVSDILKKYGDIAEVMKIFGIKSIGGFRLRKILTRFITVRTAAFVHGIPQEKLIGMLEVAINEKERV